MRPGWPRDTRKLAEEWTYRYLAAARAWAEEESPALARMGLPAAPPPPAAGHPSSAREIRDWARRHGFSVSDRGRLPAPVVAAWQSAARGEPRAAHEA